MPENPAIAFIGAGHMARSLIGGLIIDGYPAERLWATNPHPQKLHDLKAKFAINTSENNTAGAAAADVVVLTVKPQNLKIVALELAPLIKTRHPLVISIAAGIRTKDLQQWIGDKTAIVRCMPNTPALVRSGATALFANAEVSTEQKNRAESIMRAVGLTIWLTEENQLDTVTALSGSGPAYFFRIIEAMEKAAIELGLSENAAHLLTLQTALGAARMALESEDSVDKLRKQVTSPGGTTESALQVLEAHNINQVFTDTIRAAQRRSIELAELFGQQ